MTALRFSANLTMLYTDRPFLERFAVAAADGFDGVEFVSMEGNDIADVAAASTATGLPVALFNVPSGDWAAGERGIAAFPDRVDEFREGVVAAAGWATALGTPRLNVLAGKATLDADPDRLHATLVENVRFAAETLEAAGVQLVIEAVNSRDVPGFVLPRIADADRVRQAAGIESIGLQYDIYHAQVMQGDLLPTYRRHSEHIRHIQIADHPGRHEPGTGEIRYEFLLPAIAEAGYDGWIGAEYVPEAGAGWLAAFR